MMVLVSGTRLAGDGSLWWVMAYTLMLGPLGIRLLLEMRVCRASTTALLLTAISYALAVAVQLQWIMPETGARGVMVEEGLEMLGNVLLVMAMLLHSRYVILESQGLLNVKSKPTKSKSTADTPAPTSRRKRATADIAASATRSDLPAATNPPRAPPVAPTRTERARAPPEAKLTKAERRAMRRQQRSDHDDFD